MAAGFHFTLYGFRMIWLRRFLKILHTVASAGLIGGLLAYMVILITAPQATPSSYADMRVTIAAISNYVLLPSLAVALVSGLLAMAAEHQTPADPGRVPNGEYPDRNGTATGTGPPCRRQAGAIGA